MGTPQQQVTPEMAEQFGREHLSDPLPQNGIVILYDHNCPHCQHSLESTGMATQTRNGTPVKWIDVATEEGRAAFNAIEGITYDREFTFRVAGRERTGAYAVGDKHITGVPATLWMKDGVASDLLKEGQLERGDLDMLVAMQQSKEPTRATGNTAPYNAPPQPIQMQR